MEGAGGSAMAAHRGPSAGDSCPSFTLVPFVAMHLAYIDESGDDGPRGSWSYVLGCVLIESAQWTATFDGMIAFRRWVRGAFGVPVRRS